MPFYPCNNLKNQNFEKLKKIPGMIKFYTSVSKIMIIWNTVPEIWYMTDVIIFIFGLFFALLPSNLPKKWKFQINEKNARRYHHFTQVYQKSWSYAILFLRYGAWQVWLLFLILDYFLHFYHPKNPKNQNF